MKTKNRNLIYTFVLLGIISLFFSACSEKSTNNWPKFLGPESGMVLSSQNLPTVWNDSTNVKWTQAMDGVSWSSPIVTGDKIFYSSSVLVKEAPKKEVENTPPPPQTQEEDESYKEAVYRWQLTCLDTKTGSEIWKSVSYEGHPRTKKHAMNYYADETPVTDGEHVWVYYGMIGVYCYDLDGNLVWKQDPGAYPTANGWGTGSSPVLYNNTLYLLVDNEESSFIIAYDALTGEEKWKKDRDEKTTYSTPVIWKNNVRTELVTLGSKARSYDPESGKLIWELSIKSGVSIPSPAFDTEHIYFGNAGGPSGVGALYCVKAGASGNITPEEGALTNDYVVWADTLAGTANPSPVLYDGLIYLLSSRGGEVTCIEASTGDLVYKDKVNKAAACWASPWIANNQLYFYDEKGVTQVIKAGREFEVIESNKLDDKFWASIAVADDDYIFKGVDKIYCVGN
ncbi:MAG TPA: PQQ-binding-like beta-propeller repeat protein [Draconibacterium sp.]|nr:PQQ-binding-like beta-propeller repeat protein [Draconibacterium sp.]